MGTSQPTNKLTGGKLWFSIFCCNPDPKWLQSVRICYQTGSGSYSIQKLSHQVLPLQTYKHISCQHVCNSDHPPLVRALSPAKTCNQESFFFTLTCPLMANVVSQALAFLHHCGSSGAWGVCDSFPCHHCDTFVTMPKTVNRLKEVLERVCKINDSTCEANVQSHIMSHLCCCCPRNLSQKTW